MDWSCFNNQFNKIIINLSSIADSDIFQLLGMQLPYAKSESPQPTMFKSFQISMGLKTQLKSIERDNRESEGARIVIQCMFLNAVRVCRGQIRIHQRSVINTLLLRSKVPHFNMRIRFRLILNQVSERISGSQPGKPLICFPFGSGQIPISAPIGPLCDSGS
jgi:hypothetical protein